MIKTVSTAGFLAAVLTATGLTVATVHAQFVYETDQEFISTGDFNGDSQVDIIIVDKFTGRVRIGYRTSEEYYDWSNWRAGGVKGVTGISVGRLADAHFDSVALTSADQGMITIVNAVDPKIETDPLKVPSSALGPGVIVAVDVGGTGNTPLLNLYSSTIYEPNVASLLRNEGKGFKQLSQSPLPLGTEGHANRLALRAGSPEVLVVLAGDHAKTLLGRKVESGRMEEVLRVTGLPDQVDYIAGNFRGQPLKDFVFYTSGESNLLVSSLVEAGGKFTATVPKSIALGRAIKYLTTVEGERKSRLLAVFGDQEPAELMDFDGANPPVKVQALEGLTNRYLKTGISVPGALALFSILSNNIARPVLYCQMHLLKGEKYVPGIGGNLANLDNRDDSTVSNIHARIVANLKEKTAADMKAYTNMIPGTEVNYQMVPIPGGEFLMGSPASEKDRKPDEGPQHRVQISPFWMGKFEVTWEEYLLFQYPDDEVALRGKFPTDATLNDLTDAVTRPSKPYPDMSNGMGRKKGLPVIAMTQHAASKYCHWLSAKTGHFYRLPTEAEWEYACRAGSTNTFYFGDDVAKMKDYAWYFDNSDSKYQKVGTKLPNAWGLYDMYGNVKEWVLDQYEPGFYQNLADAKLAHDPWNRAAKPYPHSVRGGCFDDDPAMLRSAARDKSDPAWKASYPQLPKSIWHLSDCWQVGFRFVRPLKVPPPEEMAKYWISGVERD